MTGMTVRPLPFAAVFFAALTVGASSADAATFLGSQETSATPEAFACAGCPAGLDVGFRQFALRQATVEAPEDGVITSAGVNARRIAGAEAPRVAVLRPGADGVSLAVVASAPLPLTGEVSHADDLHLPMRRGDSLGFLYRTGEVALGIRNRPRPDGAVQSFTQPCGPCGMDGGTGTELLLDAVLEPDVDGDSLGDETQDPDGGGLGPMGGRLVQRLRRGRPARRLATTRNSATRARRAAAPRRCRRTCACSSPTAAARAPRC